jgi:hypothetical protein
MEAAEIRKGRAASIQSTPSLFHHGIAVKSPEEKTRPDIPDKHETFYRLLEDIRHIRQRYGIRVRVGRSTVNDIKDLSFVRFTTPHLAGYDTKDFRSILGLYPPQFIRFCRINQARLLKELSDKKHPYCRGEKNIDGFASSNGPIYIVGTYYEEIVHHEIFHRADQESGELEGVKEDNWDDLNMKEMPYLYGKYWDLTEEEERGVTYRGFARLYGRVDVWEDRATVAEMLMSNPQEAEKRIAEDPILLAKTSLIKRDLYRWSGGRVDEKYWQDLYNGSVDESYWK